VAASRAATLAGAAACQGCGACKGKSIAVSISTAARFAEHPLLQRRGHPAHNLIDYSSGK
jgi:hypothetical protein